MNCILSQLQLHALQIMFPDEFSRPSHNNQPITYINLGFRLTTESPGSVEPGDFHICQRPGNVSAHTPNGCQERGTAPCKGFLQDIGAFPCLSLPLPAFSCLSRQRKAAQGSTRQRTQGCARRQKAFL